MTLPQSKVHRLIELADVAIAAAESEKWAAITKGEAWLVEDCERAIHNFRSIRDQASTGQLPTSNGAGLGITRALGEWGVSTALYTAGHALERYYASEYVA